MYPVVGSVSAPGSIVIDREGCLAAVGSPDAVVAPDDAEVQSLPNVVVLPGLINLHTHLELTGLGKQLTAPSFFEWIQTIRRVKAEFIAEDVIEAAKTGVSQLWQGGVTAIADTGDSGAAMRALSEMGARGVVYQEVFGPDPTVVDESMLGLRKTVELLGEYQTDTLRIGLSPHAPYTVSEELYRRVARMARESHLPVAVHIAESRSETDLVVRHHGPWVDAWRRRGIPLGAVADSPMQLLYRTGILDVAPLLIHAVETTTKDVEVMVGCGCSVAACPISNDAHGHRRAPLARYRDAGLNVGVGTDSVASVGRLDLFAEARMAREIGNMDAAQAIELMTIRGAKALEMDQEIGTLEAGKSADLCLLDLEHESVVNLAQHVLRSTPDNVVRTYVAGRRVFDRDPDNETLI